MEIDRIKPNIILGEVEINGAHGASWFLAEDGYIIRILLELSCGVPLAYSSLLYKHHSYTALARKRHSAMPPNMVAKITSASISGTAALKSAPKTSNLLKPVFAQP